MLDQFEPLFQERIMKSEHDDGAHGLSHIQRVVATAKKLAAIEGADLHIVVPAAWLHDLVSLPKNDPRRAQASSLAAIEAVRYLAFIDYPETYHSAIAHAIMAHSFSANIPPETIEAKVVQDADRLDALGATGLARCIAVGMSLNRALYDPLDPFSAHRDLDDNRFSIDHFPLKLFKIGQTMQTHAGQQEAERRSSFLENFLTCLSDELGVPLSPAFQTPKIR